MRALAIVAALIIQAGVVAYASPIGAQSRGSVTFDIPSGDASVRGRFFPAQGGTPRATVLIVPGWGGDTLDASGMGAALSARRLNVLLINFRGVQQSAGRFTYANALEDIGSALRWLRTPEQRTRFGVDPEQLVLAGNSFGGAVAMVYAASDSTVRWTISIVGADHGVLGHRLRRDTAYVTELRGALARAQAPGGSVRFDPQAALNELVSRADDLDLVRLAPRFATRAVLLIGGWEDMTAPIERDILPVYRALSTQRGSDATILTYQDGHGLRKHRERMADDIVAWLAPRLER